MCFPSYHLHCYVGLSNIVLSLFMIWYRLYYLIRSYQVILFRTLTQQGWLAWTGVRGVPSGSWNTLYIKNKFWRQCANAVAPNVVLPPTAAQVREGADHNNCVRREESEPAGLSKRAEEVQRRECIIMLMWCRYVCPCICDVVLPCCLLVL
jgi:hypothetical protein